MINHIEAWLRLPEFLVPTDPDVPVRVLSTGILAAPRARILAAGISDPYMLDEARQLGVLTTAQIDTATGAVLYRLPSGLAGWAIECFAFARNGGEVFPTHVTFKRIGRGFAVRSLDGRAPKLMSTAACPAQLAIFMDESGNTGDAKITSGVEPFGGQPSFALAAVGEAAGSDTLLAAMDRLRSRHPSATSEIKGTVMKRRPDLVVDLLRLLCEEGTPLFIELMDKWHFVATNITTFVLGKAPWFNLFSSEGQVAANALADLFVEHVDPSVIGSYSAFAQAPSPTTLATFETTLRDGISAAARNGMHGKLLELATQLVNDAFAEYSHQVKRDPGAFVHLLPPPDHNRRGTVIAMLPHVPAFAHLYGRINQYARDATSVNILHDEQGQVAHLLPDYAALFESNQHAADLREYTKSERATWGFTSGKFTLGFARSHETPGVQVADILARFCAWRMNEIMRGGDVHSHEVAGVLGMLRDATNSVGLNIVSTQHRANLFFG